MALRVSVSPPSSFSSISSEKLSLAGLVLSCSWASANERIRELVEDLNQPRLSPNVESERTETINELVQGIVASFYRNEFDQIADALSTYDHSNESLLINLALIEMMKNRQTTPEQLNWILFVVPRMREFRILLFGDALKELSTWEETVNKQELYCLFDQFIREGRGYHFSLFLPFEDRDPPIGIAITDDPGEIQSKEIIHKMNNRPTRAEVGLALMQAISLPNTKALKAVLEAAISTGVDFFDFQNGCGSLGNRRDFLMNEKRTLLQNFWNLHGARNIHVKPLYMNGHSSVDPTTLTLSQLIMKGHLSFAKDRFRSLFQQILLPTSETNPVKLYEELVVGLATVIDCDLLVSYQDLFFCLFQWEWRHLLGNTLNAFITPPDRTPSQLKKILKIISKTPYFHINYFVHALRKLKGETQSIHREELCNEMRFFFRSGHCLCMDLFPPCEDLSADSAQGNQEADQGIIQRAEELSWGLPDEEKVAKLLEDALNAEGISALEAALLTIQRVGINLTTFLVICQKAIGNGKLLKREVLVKFWVEHSTNVMRFDLD